MAAIRPVVCSLAEVGGKAHRLAVAFAEAMAAH
jgi:hypothetical protein